MQQAQSVQDHHGMAWTMLRYQLFYSFAIAFGASDSEACRVAEESILESIDEGK